MTELKDMCCGCRFSGEKELCGGDCFNCDTVKKFNKKAAEFERACEYCWNLMKNGMSVSEALSDENVKAAFAAARAQN